MSSVVGFLRKKVANTHVRSEFGMEQALDFGEGTVSKVVFRQILHPLCHRLLDHVALKLMYQMISMNIFFISSLSAMNF